MIKQFQIFSILLFITTIVIGEPKNKSLILEMDDQKIMIPFGNNVELCYEDSTIVSVMGELLNLTNGKILLRQKTTNDNFEIPINEITKISTNSIPSLNGFIGGCLKGFFIGGASVLTPLAIFSSGNLKAHQSVFIAIFLAPPAAMIGGLIFGLKNTKKEANQVNTYNIGNKNWKIIDKEIILI